MSHFGHLNGLDIGSAERIEGTVYKNRRQRGWPEENYMAGVKNNWQTRKSVLYSVFWMIPLRLNLMCRRFGTLCSILTPPMKMEQSVPKRQKLKFRRRGITQKKEYNTHHTTESLKSRAEVKLLTICSPGLSMSDSRSGHVQHQLYTLIYLNTANTNCWRTLRSPRTVTERSPPHPQSTEVLKLSGLFTTCTISSPPLSVLDYDAGMT